MTELTIDRDRSACHAVADSPYVVLQGDLAPTSGDRLVGLRLSLVIPQALFRVG